MYGTPRKTQTHFWDAILQVFTRIFGHLGGQKNDFWGANAWRAAMAIPCYFDCF
jgi:hypothetical protein